MKCEKVGCQTLVLTIRLEHFRLNKCTLRLVSRYVLTV